jgi:hypothetical protein
LSELEDMIRDVARRGELTHLSLAPRVIRDADDKPIKKGWGASFSPASSQTNTWAEDEDPVVALKTAIEEARLRRGKPFADGEGAPKPEPKAKPKAKPVKQGAAHVDLSDIGL